MNAFRELGIVTSLLSSLTAGKRFPPHKSPFGAARSRVLQRQQYPSLALGIWSLPSLLGTATEQGRDPFPSFSSSLLSPPPQHLRWHSSWAACAKSDDVLVFIYLVSVFIYLVLVFLSCLDVDDVRTTLASLVKVLIADAALPSFLPGNLRCLPLSAGRCLLLPIIMHDP